MNQEIEEKKNWNKIDNVEKLPEKKIRMLKIDQNQDIEKLLLTLTFTKN